MNFTGFSVLILMIFAIVTIIIFSIKRCIPDIFFAIFLGIIVLILVLAIGLKYTSNIETDIQYITNDYNYDTEKKLLTYIDNSGKYNQIFISEIKYDSDVTYIEKTRKRFLYLYDDINVNILHISKKIYN